MICSTARRTEQTWELVAPELAGAPSVRFEPRAYAASALTLRHLLQELPGRYRAALLIAHNPGLSKLAASLAGSPAGDDEAGLRFPTAAVAVFSFTVGWPALVPGLARLTDFTTPANLSLSRIDGSLSLYRTGHRQMLRSSLVPRARLCGAGV